MFAIFQHLFILEIEAAKKKVYEAVRFFFIVYVQSIKDFLVVVRKRKSERVKRTDCYWESHKVCFVRGCKNISILVCSY